MDNAYSLNVEEINARIRELEERFGEFTIAERDELEALRGLLYDIK